LRESAIQANHLFFLFYSTTASTIDISLQNVELIDSL